MSCFQSIEQPKELDLLLSFVDLTKFVATSSDLDDMQLFALMDEFFGLIESTVQKAGGMLLKPMGDAALIIFEPEKVNEGVAALLELKEKTDQFMSERGYSCKLIVKVGYGPVVCGKIGNSRFLDVYGSTVNETAMIRSFGFALSAGAFRALSPEMREKFKKHTPAIRYIPVSEPHRN